jgi:chromosome partitioning protein
MIIMLCSQKGGSGKSTVAVNLASFLAKMKKDCVLVDSDMQKTASTWAMDREADESLPKVYSIQKQDNIRGTLLDMARRYEYVVVDSPGRDCREMRTGITAADLLIVPLKCSQPDLDTLPTMKQIIEEAKDFNPKVQVKTLLTMVSTNPLVTEKEESTKYLKNYPELPLLLSVIHERKVYRDCMSQGKGVHELNNEKATQEIKQLIKEILCLK